MGQVLLHIGYPKTGTTFLQQQFFSHHPQLRYVNGGIAGFYTVSDLVHYALDENESTDTRYYVLSSEHLTLPFVEDKGSESYDIDQINRTMMSDPRFKQRQAHIARTLYDIFSDSTILIVTRGFASIMPSIHSQYVLVGGRRSAYDHLTPYLDLLPDILDYTYVIEQYRQIFGSERLVILPYELLQENPKHFVNVLEDRLGLCHAPINSDRINPALDARTLYWYPRISRLVANTTRKLGPAAHARLYKAYVARLKSGRFRPFASLLNRVFRDRSLQTDFAFISNHMHKFKGRAAIFQHDPLYAPYAEAYLLD